jgi:hypothetical protein
LGLPRDEKRTSRLKQKQTDNSGIAKEEQNVLRKKKAKEEEEERNTRE